MLNAHEAEIARAKARADNVQSKVEVGVEKGSRQDDSDEGQKAFEDMTDLQNDEFIVSFVTFSFCRSGLVDADARLCW